MQIDNGLSPKVLLVDLSLGYGGSTSRVLTLLQRSQPGRIGLASLEGASVTEHARRMGLPVHVVGKRKTDPAILRNMTRVVREEGYQVLDSQNIQAKLWASLAAAATGASLVSTMHSWYIEEHGAGSLKGKLYTALELLTNRGLDLYITVSKKDTKALVESGIPAGEIELVYNAVDIDAESVERDPRWLREKFNLPEDSLVCTAVGRLVYQKNHEALVAAMRKAVDEVPNLVCLIIGVGQNQADLENQIRELGLEKHIFLLGYLDRQLVLKIIKSSDIYVMPSRYEGTPIALLEAAALGAPVLATYAGGVPELVRDQEHALLVESSDVDGMARALVKLCCEPEFAAAMAGRAQQHVREVFSLERQLHSTWSAYQRAWNHHNGQQVSTSGG
jgi:glycosyltransferase involved in cell wall biosynthesis